MLFAQRGPTMVPKYHRWLTLWRLARLTDELSVPGLMYKGFGLYRD